MNKFKIKFQDPLEDCSNCGILLQHPIDKSSSGAGNDIFQVSSLVDRAWD